MLIMRFRKQVEQTKAEAAKDGVVVPETVEEYVVKAEPKAQQDEAVEMMDFDDEYYDYGGDDSGEFDAIYRFKTFTL